MSPCSSSPEKGSDRNIKSRGRASTLGNYHGSFGDSMDLPPKPVRQAHHMSMIGSSPPKKILSILCIMCEICCCVLFALVDRVNANPFLSELEHAPFGTPSFVLGKGARWIWVTQVYICIHKLSFACVGFPR
jgi:hypothetical protein